jgi:hypothetical protein
VTKPQSVVGWSHVVHAALISSTVPEMAAEFTPCSGPAGCQTFRCHWITLTKRYIGILLGKNRSPLTLVIFQSTRQEPGALGAVNATLICTLWPGCVMGIGTRDGEEQRPASWVVWRVKYLSCQTTDPVFRISHVLINCSLTRTVESSGYVTSLMKLESSPEIGGREGS